MRERIGSGTEYVVPHNHYRTADARWMAVACTNQRMLERLAEAMGAPELLPRYPTMPDRVRAREELDARVQAWVGGFPAEEALRRLDRTEVPASLVYSVRDLFADPQVKAREDIAAVSSPSADCCTSPASSRSSAGTPGAIDHLGPVTVGEHNDEIYGGRLGLTGEELATLRASYDRAWPRCRADRPEFDQAIRETPAAGERRCGTPARGTKRA